MKKLLEIRLACVEDGLDNIGFRKFAAFVKSIHENTKVIYITTGNVRSLIKIMSEKDVAGRGINIPSIKKSYITDYHRTMGNCLVFALAVCKIPRWLYKILRNKVYPVHTKQAHYPILFFVVRMTYLMKRTFDHLRFMDFSILPGKTGYYLWKFGIIGFWQRFILRRYRLPEAKLR